jgi:hypothetical protein
LRVTILDEHFLYEVLDFLNRGATVLAEVALEFSYHLVTDSFGLFTVFSAHSFSGFPNGSGYTFLIEGF